MRFVGLKPVCLALWCALLSAVLLGCPVRAGAAETVVYLSDLNWDSATTGWETIKKNLSAQGNPITLNGKKYDRGVGTHAHSEIVYNLDGKFASFWADAGVDDEVPRDQGSVLFEVRADGVELFTGRIMRSGMAPQQIVVDVTGKKKLSLIVTDAGNGIEHDHADWADARLSTSPVPPDKLPKAAEAPVKLKLFFDTQLDGKPSKRPYYLCLPRDPAKADPKARWPMLVFLHGIVEGGEDHQNLFIEAIPLYCRDRADYMRAYPFIFLSPQGPMGRPWQDPEMVKFVIAMIEKVKAEYPVDPDRIYLTGLSSGGTGTWHCALARPDLFAAIAPVSGQAVQPETAGEKLKKVPAWIIVGGNDGGYTQGAQQMAEAYRRAGAECVHTVVPNFGHVIWDQAYLDPKLYDFLLQWKRGGVRVTPEGLPANVKPLTAEEALKEADKLVAAGDDVAAYRLYVDVTIKHPKTPQCDAAYKRAHELEGKAGFAQRYKAWSDEQSAGELLRLARKHKEEGQAAQAEEAYRKIAQTWPESKAAEEARKVLGISLDAATAPVAPAAPLAPAKPRGFLDGTGLALAFGAMGIVALLIVVAGLVNLSGAAKRTRSLQRAEGGG